MKPTDVKLGTYIDHGVEYNDKNPEFKFGDNSRILKCKMFLQRATHQIGRKNFKRQTKRNLG